MQDETVLKRDFFRKNIFTIIGSVVFILILFAIFSPLNFKNKESLDKLKKENNQLKQEILDLKSEKSFYMDKSEQLKQNVDTINTQFDGVNTYNQYLYELLQKGLKNELADSLGIFSPEYTKKGDKVAGLTVLSVRNEIDNGTDFYHVDFTGEFTVKGSLIHNAENGYVLKVKENLEKLPHRFSEFKTIYFTITNENELIKVLGEKAQKMSESDEIEIESVFKNYSYNFVPESNWVNRAEFIRLVSQN